MATAAIDRLNYEGIMTESDQTYQFPRDYDTEYPQAIKDATCLIAAKYLEGITIDDAREEGRINYQAYGSVKQDFKDVTLPHMVAGILSAEAWDLLVPFLKQRCRIKLDRVS